MSNCFRFALLICTCCVLSGPVRGESSKDTPWLRWSLLQYPDADLNNDGVLTLEEAQAYPQKPPVTAENVQRPIKDFTSPSGEARRRVRPSYETEIFVPTAEQLSAAMQAESPNTPKSPLQVPKGHGLRILSTGHSWVAPAVKTLPFIARAAGYTDQQIRSHTSGGGTGSANSIWRKELGQYGEDPARTILLPAVATGEWDVMTWGTFHGDRLEHYTQWIDVCLAKNPDMKFYIQDGWVTYTPELKALDNEAALSRLDERHRESPFRLVPLFTELQNRYPGKVHVIAAGEAVLEMLHLYYDGQLPDLDCVSEHLGGTSGIFLDGGHFSRTSGLEWLDGYVYFATLYGQSPALIRDWQPPNVAPQLDQAMRAAAWKAVCRSPFSGITDKDGDGHADKPAGE
ncbi:MAG: hypothetical protein ACK5Q5_22265 [Planctomycetaceae bacterium]